MYEFVDKSDFDLQQDVTDELKWDPSITSTYIHVGVKGGIATLSGTVPHYLDKVMAEKAAQRISGIRGVADELSVNLMEDCVRGDEAIASAAASGLEWNFQVPNTVKVSVDRGWITLRGEVEWDFQRTAAKETVHMLFGVKGVTNEITIKSKVKVEDIKSRIQEALKRTAETEGRNIKVEVAGNTVSLSGNVHSLSDVEDARLAAYNAPGVYSVKNNLKVTA
jgi:osmotically-inducible protein OsmY